MQGSLDFILSKMGLLTDFKHRNGMEDEIDKSEIGS